MLLLQIQDMSKEMSYLQCKICQKEFPRYDQRGFRNAGFTAHQNRCIEKESLSNLPTSEQQPSTVNRQRMLLPAPSSSPPSHHHRVLTLAPGSTTTTAITTVNNLYDAPMPTTEELLDTVNVPLDDSVIMPAEIVNQDI
ncbi:hypothetical protein MBANPS3_002210 [Mucor bainieri]